MNGSDPPLHGWGVAELELDHAEEADAFPGRLDAVTDVATDERFTGDRLVRTEPAALLSWVANFRLPFTRGASRSRRDGLVVHHRPAEILEPVDLRERRLGGPLRFAARAPGLQLPGVASRGERGLEV